MLKIKHRKLFIFLFLVFLLIIDLFILSKLDPLPRQARGYGFGYPVKFRIEEIEQYQFGWRRVVYNFEIFFLFWSKPPFGKTYQSLKDFLSLDYSPLSYNIAHFFAFLTFAIILLWLFRLNVFWVLIIGLFFNIFHEYIAEGIYMDPSFNDLWVDTLGLLMGLFIFVLFIKKK